MILTPLESGSYLSVNWASSEWGILKGKERLTELLIIKEES